MVNDSVIPEETGLSQDTRRAPRIAAGRPGCLYPMAKDDFLLHCGIVDLSITGCRIIIQEVNHSDKIVWKAGESYRLEIRFSGERKILLPVQLVWVQRVHGDMDMLGFRFMILDPVMEDHLRGFVTSRMRAGAALCDLPLPAILNLDTPPSFLSAPLFGEGTTTSTPTAFKLQFNAVSPRRVFANFVEPLCESLKPGTICHLSVYPPPWSSGELRTLKFSATVNRIDSLGVDFTFVPSEHRLDEMILNLLPKTVEKQKKKDRPVNVKIILLILGAIYLFLTILWLNGQ